MKFITKKTLSLTIFALATLALTVSVSAQTPTPPTTPPGSSNVFPPINTSTVSQTKQGALSSWVSLSAPLIAGQSGIFRQPLFSVCPGGNCPLPPNIFEAVKLNWNNQPGKGIKVDSTGSLIINDGTSNPDKNVLTSDATGKATWKPALPTGTNTGDTLVWDGTAWVPGPGATLPSGTDQGDIMFWSNTSGGLGIGNKRWMIHPSVKIDIFSGGKGSVETDYLDLREGASGASATSPKTAITTQSSGRVEWKGTTLIYKVIAKECNENPGILSTDSQCATKICATSGNTNYYLGCGGGNICAKGTGQPGTAQTAPDFCNNQAIGRMINY